MAALIELLLLIQTIKDKHFDVSFKEKTDLLYLDSNIFWIIYVFWFWQYYAIDTIYELELLA